MRLLSILARVGLVFLGAVLVTAVSADVVWEDSSDYEVTTSDLASALFGDWALPLLAITDLKAKEILPYTLVLLFIGTIIFVSGLLLF